MSPAPIALFTYNRPVHTRRTLEALQGNSLADQSELFVFSDGPRSAEDRSRVDEVREGLTNLSGFRSVTVVRREENLGLAGSIIRGVTELCERFGRVIVLEDDLLTSPGFLRYLNDGLEVYENDPEVASIHGYVYPLRGTLPETFFLRGADCWGWATWTRAWRLFEPDGRRLLAELEAQSLTNAFDFEGTSNYTAMLRDQIEGKNNSWAVRWYASAFLHGKLTLYPGHSLVQNIGFDDSGTHGQKTKAYDVALLNRPIEVKRQRLVENAGARACFRSFFSGDDRRPWRRAWRRLKGVLAGKAEPSTRNQVRP